jgi:D-arabinose 1-dehydrogenase-like Zn-dependent alcohol dehydrogenase
LGQSDGVDEHLTSDDSTMVAGAGVGAGAMSVLLAEARVVAAVLIATTDEAATAASSVAGGGGGGRHRGGRKISPFVNC